MSNERGQKPEIKVYIKPSNREEKGGTITLAAYWRRDNGQLQGGMDKRIVKMRLLLDDGTQVLVDNSKDSRSHYCDVWEERPERGQRPSGNREHTPRAPANAPADNFNDDDCPF
jgi:hypothetical protein